MNTPLTAHSYQIKVCAGMPTHKHISQLNLKGEGKGHIHLTIFQGGETESVLIWK